jgi:hypothetical protein
VGSNGTRISSCGGQVEAAWANRVRIKAQTSPFQIAVLLRVG